MSGWYKQQRNVSERPWFKDAQMVQLYTYLKSMAYVTDGRFEGRVIRRGSCPTTRSEMAECTGMSSRTLDRVLRRLVSYGEIIVKANNRFSVVSICDYDGCSTSDSLFGATDGIADGIAGGTTDGIAGGTTPPIIQKKEEGRIEDNILVSPYSSYKKDKGGLAYEIKERWNREFDGKLKKVERLMMPTRTMVENCISRFGRQSVDLVFEQVMAEHLRTGFVASFQFVFEQVNYQGYLKRAQVRISKKSQEPASEKPQKKQGSVGVVEDTVPQRPPKSEDERRRTLQELVDYVESNPRSISCGALEEAYRSGELQKYGIDWKPNNKK